MVGLTPEGFRGKIRNSQTELTPEECVDLFFLYPGLTDIKWSNGEIKEVFVRGLNIKFGIKS